jgi:ornithine carbamoyltransferase
VKVDLPTGAHGGAAQQIADRTDARITPTEDATGAGFVHTGVWVSMGGPKDAWTERSMIRISYCGGWDPAR